MNLEAAGDPPRFENERITILEVALGSWRVTPDVRVTQPPPSGINAHDRDEGERT
jgi:hypothetical protein